MRTYGVSTGESREASTVKFREATWERFCDRLKKSVQTTESYAEYMAMTPDRQTVIKDVGYFVCGKFEDNVRSRAKLVSRSMLTLDLDHCDGSTLAVVARGLTNAAYALASTHKSCPDHPRLRLVIPLSRDVTPEEYEPLGRAVAELIGIDYFDDTTFQPSRIMFWGSHSADAEPVFVLRPGEELDPDQWLQLNYHDPMDPNEWATSSRVAGIEHVSGAKATDPREKDGPIGRFCRAYTITELIDELLSECYVSGSKSGRYTYARSSTTNGAVVYDDLWLYSNHETDPAFGQLCNAFDLVRLHLCDGDMTKAMALIAADPRCADETREDTLRAFNGIAAPAAEREASKKAEKVDKPAKNVDIVKKFIDRFVFVGQGSQVCDLAWPPDNCLLELSDFHNFYASVKLTLPAKGKRPETDVPVSKIWLASPKRVSAVATVFAPESKERLVTVDGLRQINTFHLPEWEDTPDRDRLDLFKEHMIYLFPAQNERRWFLDWMAFNLQYPARRCKITPLHVSREQGTGRGWVGEVLWKLLGRWNCKKTKIESLMGGPGKTVFHDCFENSLLCCIDEVKQGANRFEINDQIKDLLESENLEINIKYGKQGTRRVYTNFFLQSNHTDALILEERDRRINVFTGPETPREDAYYVRLYKWLEDAEGIRQLACMLLHRDLSAFLAETRSMDTPGRAAMIQNSQSETEQLFHEWRTHVSVKYASMSQIFAMLRKIEDPNQGFEENQVRKLCQKHLSTVLGGKRFRAVEGGNNVTIWQIRRGREDDVETIKKVVTRNREEFGL